MTDKSKTFCVLPWNSFNIRANGDLRVCCNANSYTPTKGMLAKDDGTIYNAGKDDMQESRNSELLKEVRVAMMKGEWHPECSRCHEEEKSGQHSRRQFESMTWPEVTYDNMIAITSEDGTIDVSKKDVDVIDIRYGNFCNLKCRMCGPTDSHSWYEEFTQVFNSEHFDDTHGRVFLTKNEKGRYVASDYDWFIDNDTWKENFKKYGHTAKSLYIVGGEPLIIQEHFNALQELIDSGASKNIKLEYNTNLTNVPAKLLELWKHFKFVKVGASIDGMNEVFNYQRYPAKWDSVYKNIKNIDENSSDNVFGLLSFTVTNMNVFHLPEFMKWKLQSGLKKFNPYKMMKPIISFHMCHGPVRYNVRSMPPEIKAQVSELYNEYREWINNSDYDEKLTTYFLRVLDSVEKFMYGKDLSEHFTGKGGFVEHTKKLDKIRGQNILDIVPQYKNYF